CQQDDNSPYSF
nr:immunoglobulin light chain junction region [Macaca mulatta]